MTVIILGFCGSLLFALIITIIMFGWAWCIAFVIVYTVGEQIRKGKGEEDSKFLIKITRDLFKWK